MTPDCQCRLLNTLGLALGVNGFDNGTNALDTQHQIRTLVVRQILNALHDTLRHHQHVAGNNRAQIHQRECQLRRVKDFALVDVPLAEFLLHDFWWTAKCKWNWSPKQCKHYPYTSVNEPEADNHYSGGGQHDPRTPFREQFQLCLLDTRTQITRRQHYTVLHLLDFDLVLGRFFLHFSFARVHLQLQIRPQRVEIFAPFKQYQVQVALYGLILCLQRRRLRLSQRAQFYQVY